MQIQPFRKFHRGDLVIVRGDRWRVVDTRTHENLAVLTLCGAGNANFNVTRQFLAPFDTVEAIERIPRLRAVRPRQWRRAFRGLLATASSQVALGTAARARIDLLPHQLEPALAIVGGLGVRLLLADAVGLGKTIQAGLIIAELLTRRTAERVLILTPAGLRDQWIAELSHRFELQGVRMDGRELRRAIAMLPVGVNPWATTPLAIASIDYVKRPEILPSVLASRWDLVVIDEAHGVATDSDRHAAAAALASRAPYVVMLTATPHSGDARTFASLCNLGAHREPLLVFRRTRRDVRVGGGRRVHCLLVRPSTAEVRVHQALARFTNAVQMEHRSAEAWLALSVLHKRALSSPWALEQSVRRRLLAIDDGQHGLSRQLSLPLDPSHGEHDRSDEEADHLSRVALADPDLERRLLTILAALAHAASRHESKIAALRRLVYRIGEPVVIFTEYRDTLVHVGAALRGSPLVIHGGLSREERAAVLEAFVEGRQQVLLATDAAAEGLNLHQRCRVVVNIELPWNPMRLEQRIGRVDRLGQRRTVHAFHLIARATGEPRVLARLRLRVAQAQEDIGAPNPIDDERTLTKVVMGLPEEEDEVPSRTERAAPLPGLTRMTRLEDEGVSEARRLEAVRACSSEADERARVAIEGAAPWLTRARHSRTRCHLGRRFVLVVRVICEDGFGRIVQQILVPVTLAASIDARCITRAGVAAIIDGVATAINERVERKTATWRAEAEQLSRAICKTRLAREQAIASMADARRPASFEPRLFDRRAEHAYISAGHAATEWAVERAERATNLQQAGTIVSRPPEIVLVLTP